MIGATIDDAAGEAFDKVARVGLGYPGGPAIDLASDDGDPAAVAFPRGLSDHRYNLSFSGLKTSVVSSSARPTPPNLPSLPDLAASLQEAIVDVLLEKTFNAVDETRGADGLAGEAACWPTGSSPLSSSTEAEADSVRRILAIPRANPVAPTTLP